jgi:hypothetical protein
MTPIRPERFLVMAAVSLLISAARPAQAEDQTMSECLSANERSIHLRGDHKLRQARDEALVCAASSCPAEVRDTCQNRIAELSAAIPTIVFLAKDGAGHDLVAVRVSMDGTLLADRLDGSGIPIDPGLHTFTFEVAGQPAVEQSFVIGEGQKDRHETVTLGAAVAPAPSAAPSPMAPMLVVPVVTPTSTGRDQRIVSVAVGTVGVVGLGIGAVFGAVAASDWSSAKAYCAGKSRSCQTGGPGAEDEASAQSKATVSTVGFIAGGALAAAGVVLFLTAPRRSSGDEPASARGVELVPTGGPGGADLTIRASF